MAQVAPAEIFFTDDRAENVAGALAAGWQAVQFQSVQALSEDLRSRGVQFNG
jgi:FMN phosphatase YigB (HAD superfamily)